ncbi:IS66 family transposase, partial [Acidithiobacillus ferridurans]|nr:IS66 family transposase [Acidithiobacillus ferridurans]
MRNNQAFLWTKVPVIDTILLMKATTAAALFPTPLSLEQAAAFTPQQVLMAVQGW